MLGQESQRIHILRWFSGNYEHSCWSCCSLQELPFDQVFEDLRPQAVHGRPSAGHIIGRYAACRCGRSTWQRRFSRLVWMCSAAVSFEVGLVGHRFAAQIQTRHLCCETHSHEGLEAFDQIFRIKVPPYLGIASISCTTLGQGNGGFLAKRR